MDCFLFVDFGSTNTKLTLVDHKSETVVATAKSFTTVETDVMIGFNHALDILKSELKANGIIFSVSHTLACSSAAGGVKIIAIGLVPELTSEAAKRASLVAGGKVINTYSYSLTKDNIKKILGSNADIVLLTGGTDGGNERCILHNANMLAEYRINIPVIVAGNSAVNDKISKIFTEQVEFYVVNNVMPKVNQLNVEDARATIRDIFMKKIIHAKGMQNVENKIGSVIIPTPASVLKAGELLSMGTMSEPGIGDLAIVDVGGATTDVYSMCNGDPTKSGVIFKGLQEPFVKRTVEGDLGMRYSISSVIDAITTIGDDTYCPYHFNLHDYNIPIEIQKRSENTDFIPTTQKDLDFDSEIAKICCSVAMNRHTGFLKHEYSTDDGKVFSQYGKDLSNLEYVIGTGGVMVFNPRCQDILKHTTFSNTDSMFLKPIHPKFLLDSKYILSAMGLLSTFDPDMAVRMLKKYLI